MARRLGAAARIVALALPALLAGCATPPAPGTVVVLLPNLDGSIGRVVVTGADGTPLEVGQAGQGARLDATSARPYAADEAQVQAVFGAAIAAQPPAPQRYLLYFEPYTTVLSPGSRAVLDRLLADLERWPAPVVRLVGHTDTAGERATNERLGLRRAETVRELLRRRVPPDTPFELDSRGERELRVPTPDNTLEPQNRRVEVQLR